MTHRTQFDKELDNLKLDLIKMSDLVVKNIHNALYSFLDSNTKLAKRIIDEDKQVNDYEITIEKECLRIILREQPVAKDLRLITSVLKMITDLERIGDHAVDICKLTIFMEETQSSFKTEKTRLMMETTEEMIRLALDSFVNRDLETARICIAKDDIVDDYFDEIKEIVAKALKENEIEVDYAIYFMMLAKYLERIGDNAVNLAQWVIFSITGEHK